MMASCFLPGSNGNNKLTGNWKMVSYYADIGDGKEHWQTVNEQQQRTIEFKQNGEFIDSENDQLIRYVMRDSSRIDIISKDNPQPYTMTIIQLTDTKLQLRPNCIEGCGEKYEKIK